MTHDKSKQMNTSPYTEFLHFIFILYNNCPMRNMLQFLYEKKREKLYCTRPTPDVDCTKWHALTLRCSYVFVPIVYDVHLYCRSELVQLPISLLSIHSSYVAPVQLM